MRHFFRATCSALLLALVPVIALAQSTPPGTIPLSPEFKKAPYKLGPGDKIELRFFGLFPQDQQEMNTTYEVQPNGSIVLKHIDAVNVNGKTTEEVQSIILGRLIPGYYRDLKLGIDLVSERLQEIFVQGYVNSPGAKNLPGSQMTVLRAIAQASGYNTNAGEEVDVRDVNGATRLTVTRTQLENGDDPPIEAGETVFVRQGKFVFISGEVVTPGQKRWTPSLTVSQAIAMSGGMTTKGKLGKIRRRVYNDDGTFKETIEVKGKKLTLDTLLLPEDELQISRKFFGGN
jgi:polysaccharide export outer membrane protein